MVAQNEEQKSLTMTYRARIDVPTVEARDEELSTVFRGNSAVTGAENILQHITQHELGDADIIDIETSHGHTIAFGGAERVKNEERPNTLTFQATIPMPQEYTEAYDRLEKSVSRNDRDQVAGVGDDISGKVLIMPPHEGRRHASGELNVLDYTRDFPAEEPMEFAIECVVKDLVMNEAGPDVMVKHACGHGLSEQEIDYVQELTRQTAYVRSEPDVLEVV